MLEDIPQMSPWAHNGKFYINKYDVDLSLGLKPEHNATIQLKNLT